MSDGREFQSRGAMTEKGPFTQRCSVRTFVMDTHSSRRFINTDKNKLQITVFQRNSCEKSKVEQYIFNSFPNYIGYLSAPVLYALSHSTHNVAHQICNFSSNLKNEIYIK